MPTFDSARLKMLEDIMMVEFAAIELNLFLDTHPEDPRALADYNRYACMLQKMKAQYEKMYGPLTNFGGAPSVCGWRWVTEPWPWEIEY